MNKALNKIAISFGTFSSFDIANIALQRTDLCHHDEKTIGALREWMTNKKLSPLLSYIEDNPDYILQASNNCHLIFDRIKDRNDIDEVKEVFPVYQNVNATKYSHRTIFKRE